MGTRKTAPAVQFAYDCFGDAEPMAREAAGRIAERSAGEALAKVAWIHHGLDIWHVRRAAKHGHFRAWVQHALPFTVRLAEMMSDAAAMLADHIKSENFSSLPPLERAVTYTLAAPSTPTAVRAEFLPRLLAGEKGLRKLVNAALKPQVADPVGEEAEPDTSATPKVPSRDVVAAVESMSDSAFRAVLSALSDGRGDEVIRALEWRAAKPVIPHAESIAERARARARTMPLLSGLLPEETVIAEPDAEDVEVEQAKAKVIH